MTDTPITSFSGEYAFLSNFYPHPVEVDGDLFPTNEHAFQALKTDDPAERQKVRGAKTPASAKALGKRVTLRHGWDSSRFAVMERLVRAKFTDPELAVKLLATGKRELIEGNTWRDTTWGCIMTKDGLWRGRNELGKILMQVREELSHCLTEPEVSDTTALNSNLVNTVLSTKRDPSEVTDAAWIVATLRFSKYPGHTARGGKWLVFMPSAEVDAVWSQIVTALEAGKLGDQVKVSTARPSQYATSSEEEVICIYTYDGDDEADVWRVRESLRDMGFTQRLGWKSDQATREGRYESRGHTNINRYEG